MEHDKLQALFVTADRKETCALFDRCYTLYTNVLRSKAHCVPSILDEGRRVVTQPPPAGDSDSVPVCGSDMALFLLLSICVHDPTGACAAAVIDYSGPGGRVRATQFMAALPTLLHVYIGTAATPADSKRDEAAAAVASEDRASAHGSAYLSPNLFAMRLRVLYMSGYEFSSPVAHRTVFEVCVR